MLSFRPLTDFSPVRPILARISFLGGISDEQLESLHPYFEETRVPAGACIAREGEEPSHIYIVREGRVGLRIKLKDGVVNKREFGVGDSFGEAALLSMINNTASFYALEDCELIALSRKALNRLRKEQPGVFTQLMVNMARDLARKLQFTDEMLAT